MYRINDTFDTSGGITLPQAYITVMQDPEGNIQRMGSHLIVSPEVDVQFDEGMLTRPPDAELVEG